MTARSKDNGTGRGTRYAVLMAGVAASFAALPVHAQTTSPDVRDFQLQPQPTPTPRAAGPASPDGTPPRAETGPSTATPSPTPTLAAPTAAPPVVLPSTRATPTPRATPSPSATATSEPARTQAPAATPSSTPTPTSSSSSATSSAASILGLPTATPSPAPAPVAQASVTPVDTGSTEGSHWPLIFGGLAFAVLAGGGAWFALRRRTGAEQVAPAFVRPEVAPPPAAEPVAPPTAAPTLAPTPAAAPEGEAQPIVVNAPRATDRAAVALEARRLSATLINATLTYRLTLTNLGTAPLLELEIAGDMIAAHAAHSMEEQLAANGETLPALHRVAELAPGESIVLGGDIRLPLTAIRPIQHGAASLFVPLARFAVSSSGSAGARRTRIHTFLVGQLPQTQSERLQPFRLDLGPRMYSQLGQRLLTGNA